MAEVSCQKIPDEPLAYALELVKQAIAALDRAGAPADVAAHLDRAMTRLEQVLSNHSGS
jgi:hypothetical protein